MQWFAFAEVLGSSFVEAGLTFRDMPRDVLELGHPCAVPLLRPLAFRGVRLLHDLVGRYARLRDPCCKFKLSSILYAALKASSRKASSRDAQVSSRQNSARKEGLQPSAFRAHATPCSKSGKSVHNGNARVTIADQTESRMLEKSAPQLQDLTVLSHLGCHAIPSTCARLLVARQQSAFRSTPAHASCDT